MKIYEMDRDSRYDRADRMKVVELDRGRDWNRDSAHASTSSVSERKSSAAADHSRHFNIRPRSSGLKMHVLDLGKLRLDKNFMVANSTVATAKNPNPRGQVIDIPVAAFFIEHPDGNVLYDTGCHPDCNGSDGRWPTPIQDLFSYTGDEECTLPARLDALGIGPDQIQHVVLSHLHCDHAGCVEYFRKSNIIVHEDEFLGAFRHYALRDEATPYVVKDLDRMIKSDLHWRQIGRHEPDQNIVEGVRLLNFGPGHAYGMLGLQVALRGQPGVILVADACYTAENYGPPMRHPGISYDSLGFERTLQRIRALSNDTGSTVWFGHDAAQFDAIRKSTEGSYE